MNNPKAAQMSGCIDEKEGYNLLCMANATCPICRSDGTVCCVLYTTYGYTFNATTGLTLRNLPILRIFSM